MNEADRAKFRQFCEAHYPEDPDPEVRHSAVMKAMLGLGDGMKEAASRVWSWA